jgi:hypothetical protein
MNSASRQPAVTTEARPRATEDQEAALKFSVVIPLFNKAAFVRAAVQSALAQSLAPLEVIVVDDGSTDGSLEAIADLQDARLRRVRQPNRGVSAARNRGIRLARGDWVALLDADDAWHSEFLAALAQAHAHCPGADLLATGFRRVRGQLPGSVAARATTPARMEVIHDLRRRWMQGAPLCSSSVALRARRLRSLPVCFYEGESYGEDLDMWFRLADHAPVALVRGTYAWVRDNVPGALSASARRVMPPFLARMQAQAMDGTLAPSQRASALWLVAQLLVTLAREALHDGRRAEAVRWLRRAPGGWRIPRWWITLAMVPLPAHWIGLWQHWRVHRHVAMAGDAA